MVRGISNSERKRCSIGYEMITEPSLILLDEPTSGLDSHTSTQICQLLRTESYRGQTVVATIHQPSAEIFMMFDRVMFLADGYTIYSGPPEQCFAYFRQFGLNVASHTNPADKMSIIASQPRKILNDNVTIKMLYKEQQRLLKSNSIMEADDKNVTASILSRRFTLVADQRSTSFWK